MSKKESKGLDDRWKRWSSNILIGVETSKKKCNTKVSEKENEARGNLFEF